MHQDQCCLPVWTMQDKIEGDGCEEGSYINASLVLGDCKGRKGCWATQGLRTRDVNLETSLWFVAMAASPTGTMQAPVQSKEEERWLCLCSHPRSDCIKGHSELTMTF